MIEAARKYNTALLKKDNPYVMTEEDMEELRKVDTDDDGNVTAIRTDAFSIAEVLQIREMLRVSTLYALAYMYEHREEADHHDLVITLRNILFAVRERRLI